MGHGAGAAAPGLVVYAHGRGCPGQIQKKEKVVTAEAQKKVQLQEVNFYYGDFKALEDINLDIEANKVTALIGPSGCGKSTVLRLINRMHEVAGRTRVEGRVLLDSEDVYSPGMDVVGLRSRVGEIFQKPNPFPKTIYDNVAYGPRLQGRSSRDELDGIVERALRQAALWKEVQNKLKTSALELSGGQQQRLCIARTLAVEPEVILMDEPCSALDPVATQQIEDTMDSLKKDYTIIIVTHNMQQAARVSEYTGFMLIQETGEPGRLVEYGLTSKIFTMPDRKETENYITGRFG
ncbi:MAG: phosphate ABC transporter ATP-binding protein [Thermoleophilia bacterium]|nr:phosphate ABC transporter ATP-binding protein [Thermoleophilia bacterium]